jgi:hypothetical protein
VPRAGSSGGGLLHRARTRRYINLPNRPLEAPFSDGVLNGETLYIAGRVGIDPKTGKPQKIWSRRSKSLHTAVVAD